MSEENNPNIDKASIRIFYEESFVMLSSLHNEIRLLREEVQNLNTDFEQGLKSHQKWITHLENVFSNTIIDLFIKRLEEQRQVMQRMDYLVNQLNAKFELIQKPQKRRRWFF
ncbi:MAG: hypothetical protein J6M43_08950 [Neisseriaceae bacterium]|nr:hypothetical protein [Neisseriaceae bacterium]